MHYMLFAFCLTFVNICGALSFGDIKVYSYLDEPLSAELELTSLDGIDPNSIIVTLAKPNDFIRYGLQRPYFLTSLLFDVVTYQDKVLVYIRSSKVVKIPYLEFLIDFTWPNGGYIKDYTILINPPPKNLNSVTRPVPLSLIAVKESETKSFDNNLQQQAISAASPEKEVKSAVILPGQTTFSDESIYESQTAVDVPRTNAPTSTEQQNNPPVSANVPVNSNIPATTPGSGVAAPIANPTPPVAVVSPPASAAAAVAGVKSTAPVQAPIVNNTPITEPSPSAPVAPSTQPAETTAPTLPANTPAKKSITSANRSTLNYAIQKLKETDAMIGATADLEQIATARKKYLQMYKDIEAVDPDAEIDFGDVIKPKGSGGAGAIGLKNQPEAPGISSVGAGMPGHTGANGMPPNLAPPVATGGNGLGFSLILVGFALGVVGVVGFGLKKGWHHKLLAKHIKNDQVNLDLHDLDGDDDIDIDLNAELGQFSDELQHEELELNTAKPVDVDLDLDHIEKEIAKLGVGTKLAPKDSAVQRGSGKSVSDLLNLGLPKENSVDQQQLADTVKDVTETNLEIKKIDVVDDTSDFDPTSEGAFKFDELELELSTASISTEQNDFKVASEEPGSDQIQFTPEPKAEMASDDSIQFTPEPKIAMATDDSIQFTPEPKIAMASDDSIQFTSEPKIENPTIPLAEVEEQQHNVAVGAGALHLQPEGTSLIQPAEDPILLKMQLAKKYLEAGDKESAKSILREVIVIATDAQKVEAEVMLSGIL